MSFQPGSTRSSAARPSGSAAGRGVLLLALPCLLCACASATDKTVEVARNTGEVVGSGVTQTAGGVSTAVTKTANGVGGAVSAPLHDFNIVRQAIPEPLLRAQAAPYALTGAEDCPSLLKEVASLDLALGPDLDMPADNAHDTVYTNGASMAAEAALDAVKDTAEGVIPMKSWVRKLSGAEKADKKIRLAIEAGHVRRAFLKGLGVMHNCLWPASPLSFEPRTPPVAEKPPEKPSAPPQH